MLNRVHTLVDSGISSNFILTGHASAWDEAGLEPAEADIIHDHIKTCARYPDITIHLENVSRHTFANITEIQKIFDFTKVNSISTVSMHYASQRQMQTLKSYLPDRANKTFYCLPYTQTVDDNPIGQDSWHMHHEGRKLVWGELMRLYWYEKRGYIRLDDDVQAKIEAVFSKLDYKP